jgi:hypothetical protein
LCLEIRFLRLLNVFLGAFSASESVSELLDAVLSFFTAVCGSLRCLLHSTRPLLRFMAPAIVKDSGVVKEKNNPKPSLLICT